MNRRREDTDSITGVPTQREENRMSAGRIIHPNQMPPDNGYRGTTISAGRYVHPDDIRIDWEEAYHFGSRVR